jgi:hypothetical protein
VAQVFNQRRVTGHNNLIHILPPGSMGLYP